MNESEQNFNKDQNTDTQEEMEADEKAGMKSQDFTGFGGEMPGKEITTDASLVIETEEEKKERMRKIQEGNK